MAVLDSPRRLAAASVVLLSLAPPLGAATRPITETDLFRFTWIADPPISPDGRRVAFTSTASAKDRERGARRGAEAEAEERESDVRVITRAAYRSNGRGLLDPARPAHVWTVAVTEGADKPAPRQVTSGGFEETSPT